MMKSLRKKLAIAGIMTITNIIWQTGPEVSIIYRCECFEKELKMSTLFGSLYMNFEPMDVCKSLRESPDLKEPMV